MIPSHNGAAKKEEPLTPSALWLELTKLPRPSREIPLPRCKPDSDEPIGSILMWPLTQEEQMAANADADRFTRTLFKDPQKKEEANLGYHHTFTNEVAIQVLFRACRDVDNINRPAFPTTKLMRETFTTDEIGVLFASYCTVQSEVGPIISHMSDEEYEAMVIRLVEGGSAFPFDGLSWDLQRALVRFLASRLVSSWMAIASLGSQPGVSAYTVEWLGRQGKNLSEDPAAERDAGADEEASE